MVAVPKVPVRMSVQEFLNWNSGDYLNYELVDGEPRAMAPASRTHGMVQNELGRMIGNHLRARKAPCDVVTTPGITPHLLPEFNLRVPDLGVTCTRYEQEEWSLSQPVLLIEILSPSNQSKAWTNVWVYTTIPSAQEILVLRSDRIGAELLRRSSGRGSQPGEWPQSPLQIAPDGELELTSIGFRIPLAEVYAGTRLSA